MSGVGQLACVICDFRMFIHGMKHEKLMSVLGNFKYLIYDVMCSKMYIFSIADIQFSHHSHIIYRHWPVQSNQSNQNAKN